MLLFVGHRLGIWYTVPLQSMLPLLAGAPFLAWIIPATSAQAIEVPDITWYCLPGHVEIMAVPGAAQSTAGFP